MQTPAPRVWKILQGHSGLGHTSHPDVPGCLSFFLSFCEAGISEILLLNLHLSPKPKLISQFTSADLSSKTSLICGKKQLSPRESDLKNGKGSPPTWASQCDWGSTAWTAVVKHTGYRRCTGEISYWSFKWPSGSMAPTYLSHPIPSCSPANLLHSRQAHTSLSLTSNIDASQIMTKICSTSSNVSLSLLLKRENRFVWRRYSSKPLGEERQDLKRCSNSKQ